MSKPCQSRGRQRRGQFQSKKRRRTSGTGRIIDLSGPRARERGATFEEFVDRFTRKKEA